MKISIFDFDGTLISRDSFLEFGCLSSNGISDIYTFSYLTLLKKLKFLNDKSYKEKVLNKLWKNNKRKKRIIRKIKKFAKENRYEKTIKRMKCYEEEGRVTAVVSASPEFYIRPIVRGWNSSAIVKGMKYEYSEKKIVVEEMHAEKKAKCIARIARNVGANKIQIYTDSLSDLPAIKAADQAVLVHPSRSLQSAVSKTDIPFTILRP